MPALIQNAILILDEEKSMLRVWGSKYDQKVMIDTALQPWIIQNQWYWNKITGHYTTTLEGNRRLTLHHFIIQKWFKPENLTQVKILNHANDLRIRNLWFYNKSVYEAAKEEEIAKLGRGEEL